jgi:hypothetical protein
MEEKLRKVKSEAFCSVEKLKEVWDGKAKLVEQLHFEHLEERGINPGKEPFQVSIHTPKEKKSKIRKSEMHSNKGVWWWSLNMACGSRSPETDRKALQLGHG